MFSSLRLSSIDPDAIMIGRTAANMLAAMLTDPKAAANPSSMTIQPRGVVERTSTNTYPNAPPWVTDAITFIRANAIKGISASDVFRHVGFSRTLVERTFRARFSSTVQKLIAETRMETARRLLATTSLPIKEIAAMSGFTTLEYFSRAFTSATGLAPTEWREKVSEAHG